MGIECRSIPASDIAAKLAAPMSANLALLGLFSSFQEGPIGYDELKETHSSGQP